MQHTNSCTHAHSCVNTLTLLHSLFARLLLHSNSVWLDNELILFYREIYFSAKSRFADVNLFWKFLSIRHSLSAASLVFSNQKSSITVCTKRYFILFCRVDGRTPWRYFTVRTFLLIRLIFFDTTSDEWDEEHVVYIYVWWTLGFKFTMYATELALTTSMNWIST